MNRGGRSMSLRRRLPLFGVVAAGGFSIFGNAIAGLALPWFILSLTGSATWMGVTAAASLTALVIGSLLGGPLIERLGSRTIVVTADLVSAVSVVAIPLLYITGNLTIGIVIGLSALGALIDGPGMAASDAHYPELARLARVPLERVTAADELIGSGAAVLGPPIAGGVIALFGITAALFITALCSLIAAILAWLSLPNRSRAGKGQHIGFLDGARFLLADPGLRLLLILSMAVVAVFGGLNAVVMPALFGNTGKTALDLGAFLGVAGAGAAIAALGFARWGPNLDRRLIVLASLAGTSLGLGLMAVTGAGLPVLVAGAVLGVATGALAPLVRTIIMRRAPAAIRASVVGASTAAALVATPLMALVAGILVDLWGAAPVLGGFATLLGALWVIAACSSDLARISQGAEFGSPKRRKIASERLGP